MTPSTMKVCRRVDVAAFSPLESGRAVLAMV
jgi:hypothetical protein